jgi:hypothetical protein
MNAERIERIWVKSRVLKQAFEEYKLCLKDIYLKVEQTLRTVSCVPWEFNIVSGKVPQDFFSLRKNIFSTLFQSIYQILGIQEDRRLLYGSLNHLFRIWVTSADNLLDDENKVVIPMQMPSDSHIMHQVISIMTADRILKQILDESLEKAVISSEDSRTLSNMSLQILLPSAAEEASEECGIYRRPEPDYILYTIHRLKTGLLFHIPFLGPETIENNIDSKLLKTCKEALDKFGLGCQLLDDIRDIAKDYLEKRHNYVLSSIYWQNESNCYYYIELLKKLEARINVSSKIFGYLPEVVYPAAKLAKNLLQEGLLILDNAGLEIGRYFAELMSLSMFKILDVEDAIKCLEEKEIKIAQREQFLLQAVPLTM